MTHSILFLGYNDKIVYVGKDFAVMTLHDMQNGVGRHLKRRTAMDPAKRQRNVQVIFTSPFDAKFEGVDWVHTQVTNTRATSIFADMAVPCTPLMLSRMLSTVGKRNVKGLPSNRFLVTASFNDALAGKDEFSITLLLSPSLGLVRRGEQ